MLNYDDGQGKHVKHGQNHSAAFQMFYYKYLVVAQEKSKLPGFII